MIVLPDIGYIEVNAYTSQAQIPLKDVAVAITAEDGTAIAFRLTDRDGLMKPVEIPVPPRTDSLTPEPTEKPFTTVNLYARLEGYEQRENMELQVFPDIVTRLELEMIPLSEFPSAWDKVVVYTAPDRKSVV